MMKVSPVVPLLLLLAVCSVESYKVDLRRSSAGSSVPSIANNFEFFSEDMLPEGITVDDVYAFQCLGTRFVVDGRFAPMECDRQIENKNFKALVFTKVGDLDPAPKIVNEDSGEMSIGNLHFITYYNEDYLYVGFRHQVGEGAENRYAMKKYSVEGYKMMVNGGRKISMPKIFSRAGGRLAGFFQAPLTDHDFEEYAVNLVGKLSSYLQSKNHADGKPNPYYGKKLVIGGWSLGGTVAQAVGLKAPPSVNITAVFGFAANAPLTSKWKSSSREPVMFNFVDYPNDNVPLVGCYTKQQRVCMWRFHSGHFSVAYGSGPRALNQLLTASSKKKGAVTLKDIGTSIVCTGGETFNPLCGSCRKSSMRDRSTGIQGKEQADLIGLFCPNIEW